MIDNKQLDNSTDNVNINFLPLPYCCLDLEQRYLAVNAVGLKELFANADKQDVLNKTPYDVYSKEKANAIVQKHQQVIRTGETIQSKESIQHTKKDTQHYHVTIMPLYDNRGNIISTSAIFTSLDNKEQKQPISSNSQAGTGIFKQLEEMAEIIPAAFYWLNLDQIVLGVNNLSVEIVKECSTSQKIVGATIHDLYPKDIADALAEDHRTVIATNKPLTKTEVVKNIKTGRLQYYEATIAPLRDEKGNIIGTYGISMDITAEKEVSNSETRTDVLKQLEEIANVIPVPFYWFDLKQHLLGANNIALEDIGMLSCPENILGRTPHDIYPKDIADKLINNQLTVIETNKPLTIQESVINLLAGGLRHYEATIAPLHDKEGNIMGTYGLSVDTTAEREAEELRRDSEVKQAKLEEQEKFKKVISQAVHDIRSPLASLTMLIKACQNIPEKMRIALRESANNVNTIAESLLDRWMVSDEPIIKTEKEEKPKPMVISLALMEALTSKQYQYQNESVAFSLDIEPGRYFDCINVQVSNFKRMLSNLINNAVKAYQGDLGEIKIKLERHRNQDQVKVIISDKGKGIPQEVLDKIKQKVSVTHGKTDGHGIGLIQVQETLQKNQGKFFIDSKEGQGTAVTLTFPHIATPKWLAKKIEISSNDTVVIIDDDDSIHAAWNTRFESILQESPHLQLKHFFNGQEALDFINTFKEKEKLFLLTDYELLKQQYNGLDIIEKTQVSHSVLVTSHHDNPKVQVRAISMDTRILPKQLAAEVEIIIEPVDTPMQKIDMVIVDDDRNFADTLKDYIFFDYHVETYYCPEDILSNISSYSKETTFLVDYEFQSGAISGLDVAQELIRRGYSRIFILSGHNSLPIKTPVPNSITVICKTDFNAIKNIMPKKTSS